MTENTNWVTIASASLAAFIAGYALSKFTTETKIQQAPEKEVEEEEESDEEVEDDEEEEETDEHYKMVRF